MADDADPGAAVEEIVATRLRVDPDEFGDGTAFGSEGLGADSLDIVELAEAVDERLGVYVPDEDLEGIDTVGELKAYVRAELGG